LAAYLVVDTAIENFRYREELTPYFPYSTKEKKEIHDATRLGAYEFCLIPADTPNIAPSCRSILPNFRYPACRLPAVTFLAAQVS
jgi:hypothetical protein